MVIVLLLSVSTMAANKNYYVYENIVGLGYIPYQINKSIGKKENNESRCEKGKNDAKKYHKRKRRYIILGAITGPVGVAAAILAKPSPHKGRDTSFESNNRDMFNDLAYLKCYRKEARKVNIKASLIGLGIFTIIYILLTIFVALLLAAFFKALIDGLGG